MADKPHYHGHRQRLKDRFLKSGAGALADYELLELVLCLAIPRRDVKPLAKELLDRFGNFAEVINADNERLKEINGIGDNAVVALKLVRDGAVKLTQENIIDRPMLSSWSALIDYCRASMAYNKTEQFRILFLDKKNVLIADEVQQEGTVDHTPVYPREVIKRALELGASALLLVHNHPSGDPTPSRADIEMTREIAEAGKKLGVKVHDHIIMGRSGHVSFKTLNLL
ncbi:MAG: DNA repair protein RadC [Sphingomonadales bacterium]|nr:DNA repair protein RadC [Sphingomonadales bacterium]